MDRSAQVEPVATENETKETSDPIGTQPLMKKEDRTTALPEETVTIINEAEEV